MYVIIYYWTDTIRCIIDHNKGFNMPKTLSLFFGILLIIFGVLSFYGYLTIEPLWLRIVILVIGALSFLTSLARKK